MNAQLGQYVTVAMVICGVALLLQAYRAPEDIALRWLAAVILLMAALHLLVLGQNDTSPGYPPMADILRVCAGFSKIGFFLTALHGRGARRVLWRREAAVAATVALVATAAWALAPAGIRETLGEPRNGTDPAAFIFVIVTVTYLASVSVRMIFWSVQLIPRVRYSTFQAGLAIIGISAVVELCAGVLKIFTAIIAVVTIIPAEQLQALHPIVMTIAPVAFFLFLLGAVLPMVDGAARAIFATVRNRSTYQALEPLWAELHVAFPDLTLGTSRGSMRRLYRRAVEIQDGLVQLAPYYDREVAAAARQANAGTGSTADADTAVQAALVRAALAAHQAGGPVATNPHPIPTSGAVIWQDEMAWLTRLAAAFRPSSAAAPSAAVARTGGTR